jgi:hypothetical protein
MTKKITSTFPSLGEVLRAITLAFDTKNNQPIVDAFARGDKIHWYMAAKIIEEHIHKPLAKSTDESFSIAICDFIELLNKSYRLLVTNFAAGNLSRKKVYPILVESYFVKLGYELISQLSQKYPGPNLSILLQSDKNPFSVVLEWIYPDGINALSKRIYPGSTDADKVSRDTLSRWASGKQVPDVSSLKIFFSKFEGYLTNENANNLKRWLLIARAFSWFEESANEFPIKRWLLRLHQKQEYVPNIENKLALALQEENERLRPLILPALMLSENLERTTQKPIDAKSLTAQDLEDFKNLLSIHSPEGDSQFWLDWHLGRWHILSGDYKSALPHYEAAVELAHYRAGEKQKTIIEEALALGGYLEDKIFLGRLKNHAINFGFFEPPKEHGFDVVEKWEIEQFEKQFYILFPLHGRFAECQKDEDGYSNFPFLAFDEDAVASKKPDLRKPNRIIKMQAIDGQVRKYPQLRFFASYGIVDAVAGLLSAGASVDQLDENGGSAMLCAIQHAEQFGKREVLDLLLAKVHAKETIDTLTTKKQINSLFCAVEYGEPDVVKKILEMGAEVDIKGNLQDHTPLHLCIRNIGCITKPEIYYHHFLEAFTKNWDSNQREAMRRQGIVFTGTFGEKDSFDIVYKEPKNKRIFEELVHANYKLRREKFSLKKSLQIIELLLAKKANPNRPHDYPVKNRTPLMLAAENNCVEAFQLLHESGGNPYQVDGNGDDSVKIAINFASNNIIRFLRERRII